MLLFAGGRLVSTGARDFDTLERAFARALKTLRSAGLDVVSTIDVDVLNIVASGKIRSGLSLDALARNGKELGARFDPEYFEGLEMKLDGGGDAGPVTLLWFSSGKVVFSGATDMDGLDRSVQMAAEFLASAGDEAFVAD